MKNALIFSVLLFFCCAPISLGEATSSDKGASEIILQSTIDPAKPAKPAFFPHGAHQARLECKTCHHGKTAEGKRLSYIEGQKIEKCETCHNSKAGMAESIATFKNAAHTLCQGCHRKNRPELVKCGTCHKK
jgi:Class III cytochrome C family